MKAKHPVTVRSILIGCLLLPVNAYWIAMVEMVWHGFHFSATSIPLNVIFIIFCLMLVNGLIERFWPKSALGRNELLVIYIMLATTTAVIAHDNMVSLMGLFTHAFWFATPENEWQQIIQPHLPKWLVMDQIEITRPFYEGEVNFLSRRYLAHWIIPIISWTSIVSLIFFLLVFTNVFLRRRWIEEEKLVYPIAQLPLEMTQPKFQFFRNRKMWAGFSIAAVIEIVNGLNFLQPAVPLIPIREKEADLSRWLTHSPWNMIGTTYLHLRLFLLGLSFLLPLDLSFSTVFFYWVRKVQFIGGKVLGFYAIPYYPFQPHQGIGAVLAIFAILSWSGRAYFGRVIRQATKGSTRSSPGSESSEPISYQAAIIGMGICAVGLYIFSTRAGMSTGVFILFFSLYLMISVVVTRIRAELGPPVHNMGGVNPQTVLTTAAGMRPFGRQNVVVFTLYSWFNGSNRSHPMPHQLEGFKLAQRIGLQTQPLVGVMIFVIVPAVFSAFLIYLYSLYQYGALVAVDAPGQVIGPGNSTYNQLANWLQFPQPPDTYGMLAILAGFGFTTFLGVMRQLLLWWPFHPVGYVLGINGGTLDHFWFVMLIASSIKLALLKYGGIGLYRRWLPFFLGLVLGDVAIGSYWSILSVIVETPLYVVWFW